jgi:uncharacterized protein YjdB
MKKPAIQKVSQAGLFRSIAAAAALAVALASNAGAQTLLHRYSFVSDASDSVGGANGSIVAPSGGAAVTINNGLTLPGGGGPGFSGYVTLPSGILNNTASLTIECWVTQSSQQTWAELFSFNNGQGQYFGVIPYPANNNNNMSMAIKNGNESDALSGVQFPVGAETYVACTFNTNTLVGKLYTNAGLIASVTVPNSTFTPGTFNTANNWFGQDPFPDPQFQGTIYEFRIWNGVVSQRYLQASAIAGSGTLINNLTPSSANLTAGSTVVLGGAEQATFTVTLPQTGANQLLATADATNWTSSNPGVLIVNSNGVIEGVGAGTATVSAKVAGVSATSATITVVNPQLLHRYSFISDASDSVGGANGTVIAPNGGTAATINNGLTLPGGGGPGFSGYVTLPQGVLNGAPSLTVECWATQSTQNTWAELFSFNNGTPQYLAFIPFPQNNGEDMVMAIRSNNNEYDALSSLKFPVGVETYIAETFNAYSLQGALYTNGALIATSTVPDTSYIPASWNTANNYLGQDPWPDPQFQGTMYEFRIWNGVVSPLYLQVSAAAGPTTVVTNLVPTTLNVNLTTTSMVGSGTQQATVVGSFPQASGVNVTSAATNWTSSNPSILTVNSSGLITAVNGGSATVSATVSGVTATSASITVATTPPTFSQLPSNQSAAVGDTVTLSAVALGGGLSYQWSLNSTPISGATNATLVLANVQLSEAGDYTLSVTNSQGHTNASATVSVVQAILEHRYSFASDATDSVGGANGTIVAPNGGSAATINNGLSLPGNANGGFGVSGYVSLPGGLLTNTTSLTIECWATQNSANTWATIWDFADNGNINFELCPFPNRNGGNMIVAFTPNGGEQDVSTPVSFPNGAEQYVALTVDGGTLLSQLYTNGALVGSSTLPNSTYLPRNIGGNGGTLQDMLGNDTYGDPQFSGTLYEFRIWDGAVTPLYLAVSAAAGPSVVVTSTTPSSIAVSLTTTTMIGGQTQNATATGTFPQASGVALNSFVTNWSSSNPSAITVDATGVVTAVGVGTATVSAMVNGSTGTSATITVQTSAPVITQQPTASESLLTGASLITSIANEGTPPFVYRWYSNNSSTPLSTLTNNAVLTVPNLSLSSAGNYYCVVSNHYGTATSSNLALAVVTPTTYQSAVMQYGPAGFWPLNESSGSIAYDVVGGDNGTYEGGYSLGVPGPGNSFFDGQTAANFDGNVAIVDVPGGMLNITNAVTVVAWVQLSGLNGFDGIVGHGDTSWRITVDGSGIPAANDGAPPADASNSSAHINDGNWHMVAYSYDGFAGQNFNGLLYLDGSLIASNSVSPAPAGNNLDVWIGGSPDYGTGSNKRIIAGNIADVAVFAEGLTAPQISAIYNGTFLGGPNTLTITPAGNNVVLNWQEGTLLQAESPAGPWTTNYSATPPYTAPATNSSQFFRLLLNPH